MRYIDFSLINIHDPDVRKWIRKAKKYQAALSLLKTHDDRKGFLQKNDLWNEFKPILIKYYGEKCWYSECDLTGSYGDVDHFRPKNKSTNENDEIILDDGYWWLAYDYLNYRLSCEKSNRPYGTGGKRDRFPLKPGSAPASVPNKNDSPLLLDPCVLEDVMLIDCDETGEIITLSGDSYEQKRVSVSKKIFNWNCFNTARREVRNNCKTALETLSIMYTLSPDNMRLPLSLLKKLSDDKTPYSSFAKKYIVDHISDEPYADIVLSLISNERSN